MRSGRHSFARSLARKCAAIFLFAVVLILAAGDWFVHHPREWLEKREREWPRWIVVTLEWTGNPTGDITDALGLTGTDVVAETTDAAPANAVLFAGVPIRRHAPAPDDITVLDRGEFLVGWSPKLRHAAWCAYHVPAGQRYRIETRPPFRKDKNASRSPVSTDYARTGYDRGHMVPNFAMASRFGTNMQARTFLLSNVAPQSPALNRGVWRDVEHRISESWTARYGEIWVIVGALDDSHETLSGSDISVPSRLWQVVVAQKDREVRALAVLVEQQVPWRAWPTRYIVSIDELEALTGFDFLAGRPDGMETALESRRPTRLWPVNFLDAFRQIANRSAR